MRHLRHTGILVAAFASLLAGFALAQDNSGPRELIETSAQ